MDGGFVELFGIEYGIYSASASEWMHAIYLHCKYAAKSGIQPSGGICRPIRKMGNFTMQHAAKNGILVSGWGDL